MLKLSARETKQLLDPCGPDFQLVGGLPFKGFCHFGHELFDFDGLRRIVEGAQFLPSMAVYTVT